MLIFLLLQITLPVEPSIEIELLDPLKEYTEQLIVAGDVRVVEGTEIVSLQGSKGERVLGVPRLVEHTKGTVLTLRLVQTYLPAAETEFTVTDFNQLAFHLGFTYTLWESSCDAVNEDHTCWTAALVLEFLEKYGTVPEEMPPVPQAWPGDDEWVMVNRRAW